MSNIRCPDEVVHFAKFMSIEISYEDAVSYKRCNVYDPMLMGKGSVWHQVVVQHRNRVFGRAGKTELLNAIYNIIEGEEFYPVAYRHGRSEDRFLVRQCQPALDKLFAQNLRLLLSTGDLIHVQVQLNVATYKYGQISPITQISKTLNKLYDSMEEINGQKGILNLSRFNLNSELYDIIVHMGCRGVLERVLDLIYRNDERFRTIRGILLSENGITTLSPFKLFAGVEFSLLDLSDNNLQSYISLNSDLALLKADELILTGNPITQSPSYPECLRPTLNNFKVLDGTPTNRLSKDYTPVNSTDGSHEPGYKIDWSNKTHIKRFERSKDWHAVIIPDANQSYSKGDIIYYFSLTASPTLSAVYPCYYKYANGEHQFLVRECFDQLQYLANNLNFEIKVPSPPTSSSNEHIEITLHGENMQTLLYYLRMGISPFKNGQIEPMETIDKALERRFNLMDRMLDLNNFQEVQDNIVLNLSSPKILAYVLLQASRKFNITCTELRLTNNKISNANHPQSLKLMKNLKAIDLGNNLLKHLDDVKELSALRLNSLRLDGNPLCSNYTLPGEYIKDIKKYFTELAKLDNKDIADKDIFFGHKNYLCNVGGYDFVEDFVTYFFGAFENDRPSLKNWYGKTSIATLTFNFNVAKWTPQNRMRISRYTKFARNLLHSSSSDLILTTYVGQERIMDLFMRLPKISYDMLSFCTDCTMFQENMVVVTVNGVYKDIAPSILESDIMMAFSRTFVLKAIKTQMGALKHAKLYNIINDQMSVFNPTPIQMKNAFTNFKGVEPNVVEVTPDDKEAMLAMLQEATCLKTIWCKRCLEEGSWDFKAALKVFVNLCENNEIPETAFN